MLKSNKFILIMFQNLTQIVKAKVKPSRGFLLSILPLFLCNRKQTWISEKSMCKIKYFVTLKCLLKTYQNSINTKSDKVPFLVYADLEWLIKKIDECKNKPENLATTKLSAHVPSGFSMSTMSSFKNIENKYYEYKGKDCIKEFSILKRTPNGDLKRKRMNSFAIKQQKSYQKAKICYICIFIT